MADFDGIRTMCQRAIDDGVMPGLALSIAHRGDEPMRCFLGSAALEPVPRPLTPSTRFDLASLTKCLATTWLLMRKWEEGLDLDAPLERLLPGYYPPDKQQLTIRLLMAHAAGLASGLRLLDRFTAADALIDGTRRRAIECFLAAEPREEPMRDALYSDIGPILVADLLEQLGEERLDHQCQRELYTPTLMHDTIFRHLTDPLPSPLPSPQECAATERCPWRERVVCGQVHDENAYLLGGVAGHAGLFAPLADLERVAAVLLDPPTTGPLTARALGEFTRKQDIVEGSSRAIGWDTARNGCPGGDRLSANAFGHTGFTGTSIWIDPELELSVVMLANRVHPTRDNSAFVGFRPRLHNAIVDSLRG
ncbi:MAG: beta-lactamase family protein [Gemmatimonadetes bacterium]|nr:beta-lactamase family protein [Gemmatimonadota bacterium]MBT6149050.1 beta-lactamase family protein [Gemmatimonadota bacterium]MBT7859708.1 beta-lactamase family protein [Gemmatimonadota bacterium]